MKKRKKFKVIFNGTYGDMKTFSDVVTADSELDAVLNADGAEYVFDEEIWDYDTGEFTDKAPKTLVEAEIMARNHDRIIEVSEWKK